MSFSFDGTGYMLASGAAISDAIAPTSNAMTMVAWVKRIATSPSRNWLQLADADQGATVPSPSARIYSDTGNVPRASVRNVSGVGSGDTNGSAGALGTGWEFIALRIEAPGTAGVITATRQTSQSADLSYGTNTWPGSQACDRIYVGAGWLGSAIGQILASGDKMAHVAIFDGALTDTELTDASTGLAAGRNPMIYSPIAYWKGDSKTDSVAGLVLADQNGGTITAGDADNPTVDDPPAASGVPKTSRLSMLGIG